MKHAIASSALVSLFLSACAGRPSTETDAALVLARHLEWSGGSAAHQALDDLTMSGKLAVASLSGSIVVQMTRDGLMRASYDVGVASGAEGIDERGGWRRNQSGQMEPLPEADVAGHRREVAETFALHLRPEARAAATYVDRSTVDGIACDRVRLPDAGDGVLVEECIGPDGALVATRTVNQGQERWIRYSDWREVRGCRFPFRQVTDGADAQSLTWERIEANQGLGSQALSRAPAKPEATSLARADVTLPLDLYFDSYLFVQGELNGRATDIVIDSGAGITVVDQALADSLGLHGQGEVTARGVGADGRKVELANDVKIRLGALELPPLTVAILDLGEVHAKLGRRMPVILGKELFHAFPVTVDYAGRRVIVHDAEHFAPAPGSVALPTRPLHDGHVMIEAQLEDLGPAWFMVDTGAGGTAAFHVPYVTSNSLLSRYPRQSERRVGGVGGSVLAKIAVAPSFTLAGHVFHGVPVTLATEGKGSLASGDSAGTLGAELLSRFTVTFDYPRQRILFQPGANLDEPFAKDRLGLTLGERDGAVVVEFVAPGSPASVAGLSAGDSIVAIDGQELGRAELRERLRQASRAPAGTSVRISVKEGVERAVVLADYY